MIRKLIVIGNLFFFIVFVASACQKQEKKCDDEKTLHSASNTKESVIQPPSNNTYQKIDTLSPKTLINLYKEISYPTPNIDASKKNTVEGVILHHTAEPTVERSLEILTSSTRKVGTHVVIDTDGTRYIMCRPDVVTYHAGFSVLNGKEGCNYFTVGIEFQGNTIEEPLTEDQINSAIEYLLPLIAKYKIKLNAIVTHEMVRNAYKKKYPQKRCSGKVDITQTEYTRFMKALKQKVNEKTK